MQKSSSVQPAAAVPELEGQQRPMKKAKKKVVRDSFKMPKPDFELIAVLKKRAVGLSRPTKKNELLRAGLISLQKLSDVSLRKILRSLTPTKAPRPMKSDNKGAIQ